MHRLLLFTFAVASVLAFSGDRAFAQAKINDHPATQVVMSYLRYAMGQEWDKSVALLEEDSIKDLMIRYVRQIKRSATLDEEIGMVRRLGKASLAQVEKMKPEEFYVAYHRGVQDRFEVTEEVLDQIKKTMRVKLLSLSEEKIRDIEFAHILVRTKHHNREKEIASLDLVSLIKNKTTGKWQVTLRATRPMVEDIKE